MSNKYTEELVDDAMGRIFGGGKKDEIISPEKRADNAIDTIDSEIKALKDELKKIPKSEDADIMDRVELEHIIGVLTTMKAYIESDPVRGVARAATLLTNSSSIIQHTISDDVWTSLTEIPHGLNRLELRIIENDTIKMINEMKKIGATFGDFTEDQIIMAKSHILIKEGEYDKEEFLKECSDLFLNKPESSVTYLLESISRELFKTYEISLASNKIRRVIK